MTPHRRATDRARPTRFRLRLTGWLAAAGVALLVAGIFSALVRVNDRADRRTYDAQVQARSAAAATERNRLIICEQYRTLIVVMRRVVLGFVQDRNSPDARYALKVLAVPPPCSPIHN